MDRRRFLATAAGSAAGVLVATRAISSESDEHIINGVVDSWDGSWSLRLTVPEGHTVDCRFDSSSKVWRGDQQVQLSDFLPGDEVVVQGTPGDGIFYGDQIETLYRLMAGIVESREATHLHLSTADVLQLTDGTRATEANEGGRSYRRKDPSRIDKGDEILAWARFDPGANNFIVVEIATA